MTHDVVRERENDEQETIGEDGAGPSPTGIEQPAAGPVVGAASGRVYREHRVERGGYGIYVREYEGEGPALVLLHGFPDNLRLYDRLIPHLGDRRIVAFDFLGWGSSDKPPDWPYSFAGLTADVDAVVRGLGLEEVVLVGHDAGIPPAIEWGLAHPDRTAGLVVMNGFWDESAPTLHPEAIWLNSWWLTRPFARRLERLLPVAVRSVHKLQVGSFFRDPAVRDEYWPLFYRQFEEGTMEALFGLMDEHLRLLRERTKRLPELRSFPKPVRAVYGAQDPYGNAGVANDLAAQFPHGELFLLPEAGHYLVFDEPARVAGLILGLPAPDAAVPNRFGDPAARGTDGAPAGLDFALTGRRVSDLTYLSRYAERWGNIAARALARSDPQHAVGLALGAAYRLLLAGRSRRHGGRARMRR